MIQQIKALFAAIKNETILQAIFHSFRALEIFTTQFSNVGVLRFWGVIRHINLMSFSA